MLWIKDNSLAKNKRSDLVGAQMVQKHLLSVVAFMAISFGAQVTSHFVVNTEHFGSVSFMRPDPVIPLGLLVMVIQGGLLTGSLHVWKGSQARLLDGVWVALVFGAFLVSYIAIVEPSKYLVPSISTWFQVEAIVGLIQFTVFGCLLGLIHQKVG